MSSEVCPSCGKTYKRLKSHLPHCKAAVTSKTPPPKHVTVNQTSPSQLIEPSTQSLPLTASPQSRKSKKASVASSAPAITSQNANTSSSLSQSSASLPPSAKKKKQKLSEQINSATMASSATISTPSPPPSPTIPKPKKKLQALIEAEKSNWVSQGSVEGTRSASEDLPSGSTPFVADPRSSRTTAQTEKKTHPDKDAVTDNAQPAFLSTDTKSKGATKTKVLKGKKAAQFLSTSKDTSSSLESKGNKSSARPHVRDDFFVDDEGQIEASAVNKMFLKSGSGHQARITLQDVKATLGRANRQSSGLSILSQIGSTENLSSKIRPGTRLSPLPLPRMTQVDDKSCLVTAKSLSDQRLSTSSQHTEVQSVKRKTSKSKRESLIPLRPDGAPRPELTSPLTPLLPPQVSQAKTLPHTVSVNEGLKVGHHITGRPTISPPLNQFSNPRLYLPAPQTLGDFDGSNSQFEVRKESTADIGSKGALARQSLGQVRLRELPKWLAYKTPRHPREAVEMVQRGWQWYYKRYIDVKKGGVGGVSMLLAGYCVLSYIWSYPHIKRDRWRKHH